jgi:hypothetical protein
VEKDEPEPAVLADVHLLVTDVAGVNASGYTDAHGKRFVCASRAFLESPEAQANALRALVEQLNEGMRRQDMDMPRGATQRSAPPPRVP